MIQELDKHHLKFRTRVSGMSDESLGGNLCGMDTANDNNVQQQDSVHHSCPTSPGLVREDLCSHRPTRKACHNAYIAMGTDGNLVTALPTQDGPSKYVRFLTPSY